MLEPRLASRHGSADRCPVTTLADSRETRLSQFDLFEVDRIDDTTHYRSRLIEQWEPTDLGRRAVFTLKSTRSRWESRPMLTSTALLSSMESLPRSGQPALRRAVRQLDRLASSAIALRVRGPLFPRAAAHRAAVSLPGRGARKRARLASFQKRRLGPVRVLSRRFERVRGTDSETVYRRVIPEPDGLAEYHVAEIVERRYDSPEHAIQGLMRGEISMLPDLAHVGPLRSCGTIRGFSCSITPCPRRTCCSSIRTARPLRSRELRLAMAYAIDAPHILSRIVLRDPTLQNGRIVTAPFATTSYAYNSLVAPREFNAGMAASLRLAASKRLKSLPVLRLVCEPGPTAQLAAAEILNAWKRVGIRAELVAADSPAAGGKWDVAYRTLRMEEPLVELWPFLTVERRDRGSKACAILPDWLRVELLELDNAADWKSAVNRLQQLQAHLYAEVECIPLWEVDDALVLRKNIRDFPRSSSSTPIRTWNAGSSSPGIRRTNRDRANDSPGCSSASRSASRASLRPFARRRRAVGPLRSGSLPRDGPRHLPGRSVRHPGSAPQRALVADGADPPDRSERPGPCFPPTGRPSKRTTTLTPADESGLERLTYAAVAEKIGDSSLRQSLSPRRPAARRRIG